MRGRAIYLIACDSSQREKKKDQKETIRAVYRGMFDVGVRAGLLCIRSLSHSVGQIWTNARARLRPSVARPVRATISRRQRRYINLIKIFFLIVPRSWGYISQNEHETKWNKESSRCVASGTHRFLRSSSRFYRGPGKFDCQQHTCDDDSLDEPFVSRAYGEIHSRCDEFARTQKSGLK